MAGEEEEEEEEGEIRGVISTSFLIPSILTFPPSVT